MSNVQLLINYFYKMGRPKNRYVRDEETKRELIDIPVIIETIEVGEEDE